MCQGEYSILSPLCALSNVETWWQSIPSESKFEHMAELADRAERVLKGTGFPFAESLLKFGIHLGLSR